MHHETDKTILLNIYERLGAIENQLKHVEKHEPRIANLERFEGRVGAYIWLGGSVASGVLFFLWEGVKYALNQLHH